MKWVVLNGLGGLIWLAGLAFAKGMTLPESAVGEEHRFLFGISFGLVGLLLLLWSNLRSAA